MVRWKVSDFFLFVLTTHSDVYFGFICQDTGLHYDRYLKEVIDFLEKDSHFREKLHNTNMEDIKVSYCCILARHI